MKIAYEITFMNGESEIVEVSLSQAALYQVNELAYKLAKERFTEVSTVKKVQ